MSAIEDSMRLKADERSSTSNLEQCDPIDVEILAVDDDTDDDIDWEQLTREAHADFQSEDLDFMSAHENPVQARAALKKYLDDILEEVLHEIATSPRAEVPCP